MPLISVLGSRNGQISEFKASLIYTESSRTARAIQRDPVSVVIIVFKIRQCVSYVVSNSP